MNQRQLNYFMEVYNHQSIKKAAEILMISQQGLSKTIINLESEMGHKLFIRTKAGLQPTVYAHRLFPYAQKILHNYDELNRNLKISPSGKEIFSVFTTYDFIPLLDTEFIQSFYNRNPGVQLNLVESTDYPIIDKLSKGEIEIAVLPAPLDTTIFSGEFIFAAKHCLIINEKNPLCQKDLIEYTDLRNQPIVLKGREYSMYSANVNRFLSSGTNLSIYMETSSYSLAADLAEQNIAIAASLDYIAKSDIRPGTQIKYYADESYVKTLYIATANNTPLSETAQSFKSLLIDYFSTHFRA